MGDLKGHVVPGTAFLLLGLWWAVGAVRRYMLSRQAGRHYVSTATFPCPFSCGNIGAWPTESVAKIVISSLGMFGEIFMNLPHPNEGIVQHATMYAFFMLSGAVDLSMHLGLPLPPGTDYAALALAFLMEGFLFTNHLHEREPLDVQIHVLLAYVIFLTVIVILLEARYQKSAILTLARSFLTILQGSWFCAVGIILYGHENSRGTWDLNSHEDVMQATIYFSWHCAIHFILLVLLAAVMSRCYRVQDAPPLPLTQPENGDKFGHYKLLTLREDDGSDVEYEKPESRTSS